MLHAKTSGYRSTHQNDGSQPNVCRVYEPPRLANIIDNLDIRGIEGLKEMAEQFQAQMQQERQAAAQQPDEADKLYKVNLKKPKCKQKSNTKRIKAPSQSTLLNLTVERESLENERMKIELQAAEIGAKVHAEEQKTASS